MKGAKALVWAAGAGIVSKEKKQVRNNKEQEARSVSLLSVTCYLPAAVALTA